MLNISLFNVIVVVGFIIFISYRLSVVLVKILFELKTLADVTRTVVLRSQTALAMPINNIMWTAASNWN